MVFTQKELKKLCAYVSLFCIAVPLFPIHGAYAALPSFTATEVTPNSPGVQSETTVTLNDEFNGISSVVIDGCTIIGGVSPFDFEDLDCTDGSGLILDVGSSVLQSTRFALMQFNNYTASLGPLGTFILTHTGTPIVGNPTITPTNFDITVNNSTPGVAPATQVVDFTISRPVLVGDEYGVGLEGVGHFTNVFALDTPDSIIDRFVTSVSVGGLYGVTDLGDTIRVTSLTAGTGFLYTSSVVDLSTPIVTQVTPIPTLSNDNTPTYVFNSNEDGAIGIQGSCNLSQTGTFATEGSNSPHLGTMPDGTYSDCSVTVTDDANHTSTGLAIPEFTIDTAAPHINTISLSSTHTNNPFISADFDISEVDTDFNELDTSYTNAMPGSGALIQINSTTLSQSFMALSEGEFRVTVGTGTFQDAAGNTNITSFSATGVYDITPPLITIYDDTSASPVGTDIFGVEVTDAYGIAYLRFGLSDDTNCDTNDFGGTPPTGIPTDETYIGAYNAFNTSSESGKYVCVETGDLAGNYSYTRATNPLSIKTPSSGGGGGGGASRTPNYVTDHVKTSFLDGDSISTDLNSTTTDKSMGNETEETTEEIINTDEAKKEKAKTVGKKVSEDYFLQVFGPDEERKDTMTRVEFLKKLFDVNGIDYMSASVPRNEFSDVVSYDWKAQVAYTALDLDIANGYTDGTFQPDAVISRIEALKFVIKVGKLDVEETLFSDFVDVLENWMKKYVELASKLGIISGQETPSGLVFRPNDAITKAEAAKIIVRAKR